MNKLLFSAALAASSFAAWADGATYDYPQKNASTLTRMEVSAQTTLARAAHAIASGEQATLAEPTGPAMTRTQVRQALDVARRNHELIDGERGFVAERVGLLALPAAPRR